MKAFPTLADNGHSDTQDGMDLRDYFAAKASEIDIKFYMIEVIKISEWSETFKEVMTREEARYAFADAMMKAREK